MTKTKNKLTDALFWIGGALLVGWFANYESSVVRTTWEQSHDFQKALRATTDSVLAWWKPSLNQTDLLVGAAGAAIVLLFWAYKASVDAIPRRDGEEEGSAAWASPKDFQPFTEKNKNNCLLMSKTEALSTDTHKTRRNLNTLVLGASGSGKTRGHVMPNLKNLAKADHKMSFVVTDPKGELYQNTHEMMKNLGYEVRHLDLVDMAHSNHFNPLEYIREDSEEEDLMLLADNILKNMGGKDEKQDFWMQSSQALLRALIAWVYYVQPHPSLVAVADLLAQMQASEQDENAKSPVDLGFAEIPKMTQDMVKNPDKYKDPKVQRMVAGLSFAYSQYRAYDQAAGETKKSIITTLANKLAAINTSRIKQILSDDEMDIYSVGRKPTIIYMCISDTSTTFTWVAAVFYQNLFQALLYEADHNKGGALDYPTHCFLDEFANIGKIPMFEILIATMRSRGLSVSVILQGLSQLKEMYKDSWETIVANCDSILFLGGQDQTTTEWLSKRLGNQTIMVKSTSTSKGSSGSYSISEQRHKRELMQPDELATMDNRRVVYILRGLHPFFSWKLDS